MDNKLDVTKSAFTQVREALAQGMRVDFERGIMFEPQPVQIVPWSRAGMACAMTRDGRWWVGTEEGLQIGMVPGVDKPFVGWEIRRAKEHFDLMIKILQEVAIAETQKGN